MNEKTIAETAMRDMAARATPRNGQICWTTAGVKQRYEYMHRAACTVSQSIMKHRPQTPLDPNLVRVSNVKENVQQCPVSHKRPNEEC